MSAVDRSAGPPLHVQVAAELRDEIRDHRLPPGSALASEAALQARFGVARSVVRQALATLVAEGLVERGRGRGSVVAPAREHHRLVQRASGLFQQMAAEGLTVTTEVLELVEEDLPAEARWLGGSRALRLERLRRVGGRPLARIRTWLPLPRCAGVTAEELTDASLHDLLARRLGARATGGRRQVRAVAADAELAAELATAPGAPLLLLEGQTVDQHGRPLEVFATWHRAEEMAFDVEVVEQPAAPDERAPAPAGAPEHGATARPASLAEAAEQARRLAEVLADLAGAGDS
ncbi:GntR family transcriptional regulator [Geodermatophilus maliterrae]|uniref:GntR family transcriptional regulator n=1 Tax=Geodermatophilus maliterrae TaxID=3162531 RepID=A0ABV3XEK4_9ACTN